MSQADANTVLAIETATKACSVALINEGVEFFRHELLPQKHAHRVLEMVDEVLDEADIKPSEVDVVAFGEGPGAFTGIRIATGVVQGLALGWDKPVVNVSSLLAMAEGVLQKADLQETCSWCALLDARMGEVYLLVGEYEHQTQKINAKEAMLLSPEQAALQIESLQQPIGIGDIAQEYPILVSLFSEWHDALPEAISVARLAMTATNKAYSLDEQVPAPVYLRNQVADTIEERRRKQQAS